MQYFCTLFFTSIPFYSEFFQKTSIVFQQKCSKAMLVQTYVFDYDLVGLFLKQPNSFCVIRVKLCSWIDP